MLSSFCPSGAGFKSRHCLQFYLNCSHACTNNGCGGSQTHDHESSHWRSKGSSHPTLEILPWEPLRWRKTNFYSPRQINEYKMCSGKVSLGEPKPLVAPTNTTSKNGSLEKPKYSSELFSSCCAAIGLKLQLDLLSCGAIS